MGLARRGGRSAHGPGSAGRAASQPPSGDSRGRAGPDPRPSHPDRRPADRRDPPDRADCRRRAGRRNEPAALAGDPVRRGHLHGQRLGTPARPPGQLHLQLRSSAAGLAADLLLDRGRRDPRARHVLHRPRPGVHAPGVPGHVPAAVHPGPAARIRPAGRRQRGPPLRPVSARRLLPPGCTARQPVDSLRDRRLRPRLDAAAAALGVRRQRGLLRVERAVQGDDPRPAAGPVRRGVPERRPPHQALLPRAVPHVVPAHRGFLPALRGSEGRARAGPRAREPDGLPHGPAGQPQGHRKRPEPPQPVQCHRHAVARARPLAARTGARSDPGRPGATNHTGHRAGVPDPGSNRLPARLPAQHVRDRDDPVRCAHRSREHRSRMALGTDAAIPGDLVGAAGGPGRPGRAPWFSSWLRAGRTATARR